MTMKIGKLYSYSEPFLMLYPDKETAVKVRRDCGPREILAPAYYSKRFGKPVSTLEPKTPLLVLNTDRKYVEVLAGDKKGWIIYQDWLDIKEIIDEGA
jgi:hypothetical protein